MATRDALHIVLGGVALGVICSVLNGLALTVLWGWFIVPIFGAPQLSIIQAIGIALIVDFLFGGKRNQHSHKKDPEKPFAPYEWLTNQIPSIIAKPAAALAVGWVLHLFM